MVETSADKLYDFYLHFYDSDQVIACKILDYLENPSNGGFKGFILDRDAKTGTKSHNLDMGLRNSRLILILLSNKAMENAWFECVFETCFSFHSRNNTDIVPIYLEKMKTPSIVRTIYSINYSSEYFWNKLINRLSSSKR